MHLVHRKSVDFNHYFNFQMRFSRNYFSPDCHNLRRAYRPQFYYQEVLAWYILAEIFCSRSDVAVFFFIFLLGSILFPYNGRGDLSEIQKNSCTPQKSPFYMKIVKNGHVTP